MGKRKIYSYDLLRRVRQREPVIHHLTNWVTIYDCANIVKALGASPVMAHAPQEVAEMSAIASALVLNIGTLTTDFVESMKLAAKSANKKGIPVILDVCGCGATRLRDEKSLELLEEVKINILKGNSSEVARLGGIPVRTRGVDAVSVKKDLSQLARALGRKRNCTVVITGKEDIVTDGKKAYLVRNGSEMLTHVVGTGCMAASVIGAFAAVEADLAYAAASGLCCYGIAAELAAKSSQGPGTFKEKLFDCIFNLDEATVSKMQRIK